MYYATCGKVKELLCSVNLHLTNHFKKPEDRYFKHTSDDLKHLRPVSIGDFKDVLIAQESFLYGQEIIELMGEAVLRKVRYEEKLVAHGRLVPCLQRGSEYERQLRHVLCMQEFRSQSGVRGFQDVRNKASAIIFAELAEKYRPILYYEEIEAARKKQKRDLQHAHTKKRCDVIAPCGIEQEELPKRYVSPYNLIERAKKLNDPNGPEKPCICDPECMCVPLCAAEPTKNCLCEECPSFCPGTEGWDLKDIMDVDHGVNETYVEEETQPFYAKKSGLAQPVVPCQTCPSSPTLSEAFESVEAQLARMEEVQLQTPEQGTQPPRSYKFPGSAEKTAHLCRGSLSIWATPLSSEFGEFQPWHFTYTPTREPQSVFGTNTTNCLPTPAFAYHDSFKLVPYGNHLVSKVQSSVSGPEKHKEKKDAKFDKGKKTNRSQIDAIIRHKTKYDMDYCPSNDSTALILQTHRSRSNPQPVSSRRQMSAHRERNIPLFKSRQSHVTFRRYRYKTRP